MTTTNVREALPYSTPMELWQAFKRGEKFVLHYHGRAYDVTNMSPRDKVVYVQPPGLPVKVFPDGSNCESAGDAIWLGRAPVPHPSPAPQPDERDAEAELNCAEEVLDSLAVNLDLEQTHFDCVGDYITAVVEATRRAQPAPEQGEAGITLNLSQARALVEFFGGEDTEARVARVDLGHSGAGLYVWCADYPEEGSVLLESEYAAPQPAPEKAEAELVELQESLRGMYRYYGEPGSRDVDIVTWNARIDRALLAINRFRSSPTHPEQKAEHRCPYCIDGMAREVWMCRSCEGAFVTLEQMARTHPEPTSPTGTTPTGDGFVTKPLESKETRGS